MSTVIKRGRWVDVQQQKKDTERYMKLESEKRDLLSRLNMVSRNDKVRLLLARHYLQKVSQQKKLPYTETRRENFGEPVKEALTPCVSRKSAKINLLEDNKCHY